MIFHVPSGGEKEATIKIKDDVELNMFDLVGLEQGHKRKRSALTHELWCSLIGLQWKARLVFGTKQDVSLVIGRGPSLYRRAYQSLLVVKYDRICRIC